MFSFPGPVCAGPILENQMIKLCASYGLKVPASQEYSSVSFHASAEVEVAGNERARRLRQRLERLHVLVAPARIVLLL